MKIVHVVSSDTGGAARAAIRINESLNSLDIAHVNSKVIVANRNTTSEETYFIGNNKSIKLQSIVYNNLNKVTLSKCKTNNSFSNAIFGFDITKNKYIKECDVINLHWINDGMMSYKALERLKLINKPIVWTLHDMWPFTGGCHYDEECGGYLQGCGNCRMLNSNKSNDLSSEIIRKKERIYKNMNITAVGCSNWITRCASNSKVFRNTKCINIPNAIDISVYKPIDKEVARNILNIKTNKKIILFGAMYSTSDTRKGFKYLLSSIKDINKEKYLAIVFGNNSRNEEIEKYLEVKYFGKLSDDYSLGLLYNCADVFVAPSIQENLANTVMESLSCGTPVVAFNIGGMSDMIKHKYNGYLAEEFDAEDLKKGIMYSIEHNKELGANGRSYVEENYNYRVIGKKYYDLYKKISVE